MGKKDDDGNGSIFKILIVIAIVIILFYLGLALTR